MEQQTKKINEHVLRITGSVNLEKELEQGKRYLIETEVDIYEIAERDNQDGSLNLNYKAKQTGILSVLNNGKVIVKAKDKKTRSQKMHAALWFIHNETGMTKPFSEFYDETMKKMTLYIDEIMNFLNTKN